MNSLYVRDTKKKIHENWATTNDNHFKVDQYYVVPGKLLLLKKTTKQLSSWMRYNRNLFITHTTPYGWIGTVI